jgi:hypothetical protein
LLEQWGKVIRPAFAKLADGTSKSGTPKSPIGAREHPDYINAKDDAHARNKVLNSERDHSSEKPSRLLCWDHPDYLALAALSWFKKQPQYKSLFDLALAIKEGKLTKMNKAGKVEVAKQFIAAHEAALDRHKQVEATWIETIKAYTSGIEKQVKKVQLEEAQARAPAGGGGCCVVL